MLIPIKDTLGFSFFLIYFNKDLGEKADRFTNYASDKKIPEQSCQDMLLTTEVSGSNPQIIVPANFLLVLPDISIPPNFI